MCKFLHCVSRSNGKIYNWLFFYTISDCDCCDKYEVCFIMIAINTTIITITIILLVQVPPFPPPPFSWRNRAQGTFGRYLGVSPRDELFFDNWWWLFCIHNVLETKVWGRSFGGQPHCQSMNSIIGARITIVFLSPGSILVQSGMFVKEAMICVIIRGGNQLHSHLPSECDYLLRVLEFMAIILL